MNRYPYAYAALALSTAAVLALPGCAGNRAPAASPPPEAAASGDPNAKPVKSFDGRFTGEVVGTPAPGSRFAKIQIGMELQQVQQLIGPPEQWHVYETGKRWIPFYYGNDVRRVQALFRGEGCLIFTGGNPFGGGGNELIRMEVDPSGVCYQP